jgi:hypothetical protein
MISPELESLPAPLTPVGCDLRDFEFMPLGVNILRDSRFAAAATGDEFRAAVILWSAAWHQTPAGSLPDDNIELANLAGFGRCIDQWLVVRGGALSKFQKCSDGRLYHPEIAKRALQSWAQKLKHHWDRERDRIKKHNLRQKDVPGFVPVPYPTFDQWKAQNRNFAGESIGSGDSGECP